MPSFNSSQPRTPSSCAVARPSSWMCAVTPEPGREPDRGRDDSADKGCGAAAHAGMPWEIDSIGSIAARHGVAVIEDAAQALGSTYRGTPAGSFGALAAVSSHETKNVTSGEGGALPVNTEEFVQRAEIFRDKGTDRSRFLRNEVDKYSWVDVGSSYGLSELNAAFLWAQLEAAERIRAERLRTWWLYHGALEALEEAGVLRRPVVPEHVQHNGHIYYVLASNAAERTRLLGELNSADVNAVFHYVPLHDSAAGRRYGRSHGTLSVTQEVSGRVIRLPLYSGMDETHVGRVVELLVGALKPGRRVSAAV